MTSKRNLLILSLASLVIVLVVISVFILKTNLLLGHSINVPQNIIKDASKDPIIIGAIYPLTGQYAFGEIMQNGAQFAIDDINSKGGVNGRMLKLIVEDSQADASKATVAFNKLYEFNDVRYYLTTVSKVGMPLKTLAEERDVLMFADITHPDLLINTSHIVRHSQSVNQEVELVNELIIKNKYDRITLFVMRDEYGLAYERELKKILNDEVMLSVERIDISNTDFKTSVTKIVSNNPDLVICVAVGQNYGNAIRDLRTLGYANDLVFSLSMSIVPGTLEAIGDAKSSSYYLSFDSGILPDDLRLRYLKKYEKEPALWVTIAYTDVELLAHAISEVGDDPKKVVEYIKNAREFNGRYESITITSEGNIYPPVVISRFD